MLSQKNNNDPWYYEQQVLGLNYRMSDVSAALGISQLKRLKQFTKERNNIADIYGKNLNQNLIEIPKKNKLSISTFHLYVIKVKQKNKHKGLFNLLRKNKIYVNLHYLPVHLQPYFRKKGFKKGTFKNSEDHAKRAISLPVYPGLKIKNINKIINLVNNFLVK